MEEENEVRSEWLAHPLTKAGLEHLRDTASAQLRIALDLAESDGSPKVAAAAASYAATMNAILQLSGYKLAPVVRLEKFDE